MSARFKLSKLMKFKLFGALNIVDIVIILAFLTLLPVVFVLNKGSFSPAGKAIQDKKDIEIDVLLEREKISRETEFFIPGEKAFITIRNVPYTKLEIVKYEKTQLSEDEPSYPYGFNFLVTLGDKAAITPDGPVVGGNKIKIGLPVVLEGFDYKLRGVVTDVRINDNIIPPAARKSR